MPVLKSVLPYVGTIVTAAAPVFTKKSADAAANQTISDGGIGERCAHQRAGNTIAKYRGGRGEGRCTCGQEAPVDAGILHPVFAHICHVTGRPNVLCSCVMMISPLCLVAYDEKCI
jgi:hypothetical protein